MLNPAAIPLALYIHMPWCIRKCPYCDFNSHAVGPDGLSAAQERQYLDALIADARAQIGWAQDRSIDSIFVGGGTPSLISAAGYRGLFEQMQKSFTFAPEIEITLEANPATLEHAPFADYRDAGINRLSLGVQTFNPDQLTRLGRLHSHTEAQQAIERARTAGFDRVNVDLMHGLPTQTVEQAQFDLETALSAGATHLSWYQLTIEPNTVFYREQPTLPDEDRLTAIQERGEQVLQRAGFEAYEVSAWVGPADAPCRHNLNYWQFGDYLAIGAGAHGKITHPDRIERYQKSRLPRDYLAQLPAPALSPQSLSAHELPFEWMMNALRLKAGAPCNLWAERTGLDPEAIEPTLRQLRRDGLLIDDPARIACTPLGWRYLNSVLGRFLTGI